MFEQAWSLLWKESRFFMELIGTHLMISTITVVIAGVVGVALGVLISEYPKLAKYVLGVVNILYTIPSIALLGLLISFTGIGNTTAIIALVIYALLPIVRGTYTGIQSINPLIIEAAEGMGSTTTQVLFRIKLPLAGSIIWASIRNTVTMTIALAGIASFVGAGGLGIAIYRGITTNNTIMILLGSVLVALLALVADGILAILPNIFGFIGRQSRRIKLAVLAVFVVLGIVVTGTSMQMMMTPTLKIATKPMTEGYILGEMTKLLVEQETGLKVDLTHGVGGGTANIHPGMLNGSFDLYPEYTGTVWEIVLKKSEAYTEANFETLQTAYKEMYGIEFTNLYGFADTYGLAVRKDIAEKYQLETYSDLAKVSDQLVLGAEYDFFEREDGYMAIKRAYDFNFKQTLDMDIGLKYQAMNEGKLDAMVVFTTDGQLTNANVKVLKDDRQFFPSYQAGNVIRSAVLMQHPELKTILGKLDGVLNEEQMASLNNQVEVEGKTAAEVAKQFLLDQGLLKGAGAR